MRCILIFLYLLCSFTVSAQSIKGQIKDAETQESIPYATVLLNDMEGKFLEGVTTNDGGEYLIKYKKGNYKLNITFMGYEQIESDITLEGDMVLDFELKNAVTELGQVTVTAERTTVEQLIDKKVINVGKDLLSSGGDAATVLGQLSEVDADENGNISLRGNNNVNILVNGKPSPLSNAELLQQVSSAEINKIEIITSPSAKYQASGLTGIINIITHKKVQKGLSITTNLGVNTLGGYNSNVNFQYGHSKVNFKLGGSYRKRFSERQFSKERIGLEPFSQNTSYKDEGNIYSINGGIDWFLTDNDEFSISLDYRDNGHDPNQQSVIFQDNTETYQETFTSHSHISMNTNANYRHYFNDKKGFLELDAQISKNPNILQSDFRPNLGVLDNRADNDALISNLAFDFSNTINDDLKIESGFLWNRQELQNTRNEFDQDFVPVVESFENIQSTYAAYALTNFKVKKLTVQAGLRGELYRRNANLITEQSKVSNKFNDLFPSLHLNYNLKKGQTLTLGYNRRTSRPRLGQVNPNAFQSSEFSIRRGNPSLLPEFSNNIDLSYQYKKGIFSISPSVSYRLKNQVITRNQFVNDEGLTEQFYVNNGKSDAWGIELTTALTFPKWLKTDFSYNWNYAKFRADRIGFVRNFSINSRFRIKNKITFSKKTNLAIDWRYSFPSESFNRTFQVNQNLDLAIRHKILKNKGNINLRFTDIFNTRQWAGTNTGEDFTEDFDYKPLSRVVHLAFSYTFKGGTLKKRSKKKREYGSGVVH